MNDLETIKKLNENAPSSKTVNFSADSNKTINNFVRKIYDSYYNVENYQDIQLSELEEYAVLLAYELRKCGFK